MKKAARAPKAPKSDAKQPRKAKSPAPLTDERAGPVADWREQMLARIRQLIQQADPEAIEEVKWRKPTNPAGVPVWSHSGMLCTGEKYKNVVKVTFAKGASLPDPARLFNGSLDGNTRRAIDLHEGDKLNEKAFRALIRAAVALNTSGQAAGTSAGRPAKKAKRTAVSRGR